MKDIILKRAYDKPAANDGYRLLVDRVWPRGVSKEDAKLDDWQKELAPSTELRKWFGHKAERFNEFKQRYKKELQKQEDAIAAINKIRENKRLCLVYGAKDTEHNQAVVLKDVLENN